MVHLFKFSKFDDFLENSRKSQGHFFGNGDSFSPTEVLVAELPFFAKLTCAIKLWESRSKMILPGYGRDSLVIECGVQECDSYTLGFVELSAIEGEFQVCVIWRSGQYGACVRCGDYRVRGYNSLARRCFKRHYGLSG